MKEVTFVFKDKDVAAKLAAKFMSLLARCSTIDELPEIITEEDLDIIHLEHNVQLGRTLCNLLIADGHRAVKPNNSQKVNCDRCKSLMRTLK